MYCDDGDSRVKEEQKAIPMEQTVKNTSDVRFVV
jgi:hypothetical protein